MTDGNVISLNGGPSFERISNENTVDALREALVRAEAEEIVGVVICQLHFDQGSSYDIAGMIGGYSLLGALGCAQSELVDIVREGL